jgi:glycosyltransferase involved in cell wall biosynthesis
MVRPSIELSMIVKDGARSLGRCLESVAPLVDRILIGDTGSTDKSCDIGRSFGAEIVSIPWQNDFAEAHNAVLAHSRCDWILVLDADEALDPTARPHLAAAIAQTDLAGYDICRWNYLAGTNSRSADQGALANPFLLEAHLAHTPLMQSRSILASFAAIPSYVSSTPSMKPSLPALTVLALHVDLPLS